jgi:membrane protease YdiL (CAAX protease family)
MHAAPGSAARDAFPSLPRTIGLLLTTLVVAGILAFATIELFPTWPSIVQMALPTEIALLGAVTYAVSRTGLPWREALGIRSLDSAALAPLLFVVAGAVTVFSELYLIIQRIVPVPLEFERMLRELMQISGTVDLLATIAIAVLVAPALEEALFRGVLLQGLMRRRGPAAATIWTASFFALYHVYNPWQIVPTFFLGLVLGWVVLSTRSLLSGIVVHAAFNAVSLAIFAAPVTEREPSPEAVPWVVAAIFGILLLGSAAFLIGMAWLESVTEEGWFAERPDEPDSRTADPIPPYAEEETPQPGPFRARR